MAKQTINQGTQPTGAGGDTFRSGSAKLQANDNELYAALGANAQGVIPAALPINKGGTGASIAAVARSNLGLGSAAAATLTISSNDPTSGRALKVGDFGIGIQQPITQSTVDVNEIGPGEFNISSGAINAPGAGWLECKHWTNGNSLLSKQIWTAPYSADLRIRQKVSAGGVFSPWKRIWTEDNTSIDGNGFIKAASPIVKLFADHIELNDEAEQQDISFDKLGVGHYLIKDSSGFAQHSWYIETPKDANGNVLFSVIYETLENADISIKTYKKKFDLKTSSIVADLNNPVDITEDRWIDLRLQELAQAEIEILESIAPAEFQPTGLAQAVAAVMESYYDPEQ